MRKLRGTPIFGITLLALASGCDGGLFGPDGRLEMEPVDSLFTFDYEPIDPDLYPIEEPPEEELIGSLYYGATVIPEDTVLGADPMSLWITVTVRNPTSEAVQLPVRGCTVWPRAYSTQERSGTPTWTPSGECMQAPHSVLIPGNSSENFFFLAHDVMLAGAFPDGRYYFTAEFRGEDETIQLKAGSADVRLREPGLEYEVSLRSLGRGLEVDVGVVNRNDIAMVLQFGACSLTLDIYQDRNRTRTVGPWRGSTICEDYLGIATIPPGETSRAEEFSREFSVGELPELDPGRYFLTVNLRINWRTYSFPIGTMRFH